MARFGIDWKTFLELTPFEFYSALKFKSDEEKNQENMMIVMCETIRTQTHILASQQLPRGKSINPLKMMPFPWDNERKKKVQSLEEMKKVMRAIALSSRAKYIEKKTEYIEKKTE